MMSIHTISKNYNLRIFERIYCPSLLSDNLVESDKWYNPIKNIGVRVIASKESGVYNWNYEDEDKFQFVPLIVNELEFANEELDYDIGLDYEVLYFTEKKYQKEEKLFIKHLQEVTISSISRKGWKY